MKFGVPVRVMLNMLDSREISEWRAYETYAGPLDSTWDSEVLAQLHELLQQHLIVTVDANSKKPSKQKVHTVPRPWLIGEDTKKSATSEEKRARVVAQMNAEIDLREKNSADGYGATYM